MTLTTPYQEGDPASRICFIAEAPARVEMTRNRPLVGDSGQLFDSYCREAGIVRSDTFIANVCRTPIRNISEYVTEKGLTAKGRIAAADLKERIEDCKANVFVPMGKLAMACMTGKTAITKVRGSPLASTLLRGRKCIPSIHPAATLPYRGKYIWRFLIISDFVKALRHSTSPDLNLTKRNLILDPSYSESMDYLHALKHESPLAFDIETYNEQVSCISFAHTGKEAISVPFVQRWDERQEMNIWLAIAELLGDRDTEKLVQGGFDFDIPFLLYTNRIPVRGLIKDTMIAQRILYPDFPSSLEFLCSIYTDEPYYKDDRKLWKTPARDPMTFWAYNAKDSAVLPEIWDKMEDDEFSVNPGWWQNYLATVENYQACLWMMTRGTLIDTPQLAKVRDEIREELKGKEADLLEASDMPFNPNSPKQCLAYFYTHKGIKPYMARKKDKNGRMVSKPTCDDKALARIVRRFNLPEARLAQEVRGLRKLMSTYLDISYDPDKRLRCTYKLRGTSTGRLSSAKTVRETGMNNQNLDPRFKGFMIPDDPPEYL